MAVELAQARSGRALPDVAGNLAAGDSTTLRQTEREPHRIGNHRLVDSAGSGTTITSHSNPIGVGGEVNRQRGGIKVEAAVFKRATAQSFKVIIPGLVKSSDSVVLEQDIGLPGGGIAVGINAENHVGVLYSIGAARRGKAPEPAER